MKNLTFKSINGLNAFAAYSHQKNNIKFYVAVCEDKKVFGQSIDEAFEKLQNEL